MYKKWFVVRVYKAVEVDGEGSMDFLAERFDTWVFHTRIDAIASLLLHIAVADLKLDPSLISVIEFQRKGCDIVHVYNVMTGKMEIFKNG